MKSVNHRFHPTYPSSADSFHRNLATVQISGNKPGRAINLAFGLYSPPDNRLLSRIPNLFLDTPTSQWTQFQVTHTGNVCSHRTRETRNSPVHCVRRLWETDDRVRAISSSRYRVLLAISSAALRCSVLHLNTLSVADIRAAN